MKLALSNTEDPGETPDPLANRASNRRVRDVALFGAGAALYWILVSFFSWFHDENIVRLSPFFVGAAGFFLGVRAGALATVLAICAHVVVFERVGLGGASALVRVSPAAHVGIVLLGPLTGYLRSRLRRATETLEAREQADSSHYEAERRFHQIVDNIQEVFWIVSADRSRLVYLSPAFEKVFGVGREAIANNPRALVDIAHPDDREKLERVWATMPHQDFTLEYRINHPGRGVRWIRSRGFAVRDRGDPVECVAGVASDVTRIRFEQRMRLGRSGVMEKLTAGTALPEVLASIVDFTVDLVPDSTCTIALYDGESNRLSNGAVSDPGRDVANLEDPARGGTGAECLRRAVERRERVVETLGFAGLPPGGRTGINACWAQPVLSSRGEVLGALGVFLDRPREPSADDEDVLRSAVELASLSIEQRNTDIALKEREERLRSFIRHSPAPVAMFDTEMRYLVASRSWQTEHGLEGQDLTGRLHYDVIPDLPVRWKENHRKCLRGAILEEDADRVVWPDGRVDWVKWAIHPWRRDSGKIGGIILYAERVTDHVMAQRRLTRSEEQYRFLVENIPDTICELDPDGNILFANRPIYGTDVDDLVGTPVFDYLPETRRDDVRRYVSEAVASKRPVTYNVKVESPGGPGWWSNRIIPVEENGVVVRLLVLGTDVTDRKIAEDALRRSEQRYRRLFEDNLAGDFIATPAGNIITCNAAFVRIFGFASREAALSFNAARLFPDRKAWDEFLRRLESNGRLVRYEEELRSEDGKAVFVVANFVGGFDGDGHLTEIKGYVFDNTIQKRLEEQLVQAQKMEAVGRLAGGIAHDFNNMLTSISGYNELLLNKIAPDDPLHRYARQVMKATDRAAGLTKRLLAFSRRQLIQPRVIDVLDIVRNMESVLQRTIGENIELETVSGSGDKFIEADPSLIETVLLNLAINARDAMPDGGKLTIGTDKVTVDKVNQHKTPGIELGEYVLISFTDTGLGIDGEIQSKIFEPFFTTKQDGQGTGLGLATVYSAVRQSGGHVRVQSQPNKGATFSLYFPSVAEGVPATAKKQVFLGPSAGSETVLVAEDEPTVQHLIRDVLTSKGYRVLMATDGSEAMEVAGEYGGPVHLLIADVVMPRMNGRELVNGLRTRFPNLKVLYISGYIGKASVKIAELGPGTSFLSKPFSAEALARKIRLLLDSPAPGERALQPRTRSLHHPAL